MMNGELTAEVARRAGDVAVRVRRAAERCGRDPGSVRLVAVSKRKSADHVRAAYEAGLRDFGENYVQEALAKIDQLPGDIRWHMIGHLQSNKAKPAAEGFALVHTVDRASVGKALDKAARARGLTLPVLLQVNMGGEATKSGADAEGAIALARQATQWSGLKVRGLMCIPPWSADPEKVRPHFRALRGLSERISELGLAVVSMDELSMGMSHDFEVAIEEGATLVRVGSAIFGERD